MLKEHTFLTLAGVLRSSGVICRCGHACRIVLARMMHFAEVRVLFAVRSPESVRAETLVEVAMQSFAYINAEAFVSARIDCTRVIFVTGATFYALAAVASVGALQRDKDSVTSLSRSGVSS